MFRLFALNVSWDMNGDGFVSISDLGLLLKWLACLPGNLIVELLGKVPALQTFLEIHASPSSGFASFYGWPAWTMSVWIWILAWAFASVALDDLRKNGLVPR